MIDQSRDGKGMFKKNSTPWNKSLKGFMKGRVTSEEAKRKLREKAIGRGHTEETKQILREHSLGKHYSFKTEFKEGMIPWNKGKKHSKITLKRLSKKTKRQWKSGHFKNRATPEYRKKLRIAKIKQIEKQFNNGMPMNPTIGNNETHILDTLEKSFGYEIFRQHKVSGYFIDGFCPALNLAIEVDEIKHHRRKYQEEKDMIRENNIKQELNCQFLRLEVD